MPELPEVETIKRSLAPRLLGKRLEGLEVFWPKAVQGPDPAKVQKLLEGQVIGGLERRGKYLVLRLAAGDRLIFHLRMTGQLLLRPAQSPREPHTRLIFTLDNGEELRYTDVRKFGGFCYVPAGGEPPGGFAALGPEPLSDEFSEASLCQALQGRKAPVKSVLLDQRRVAGIGNIYADEILHRAGISPLRAAGGLAPHEITELYRAVGEVLAEGVAHRGTTKRNYVDGDGRPGQYQERLRVYGRGGLPCPACGEKIVRTVVGGRGTYYCTRCQT